MQWSKPGKYFSLEQSKSIRSNAVTAYKRACILMSIGYLQYKYKCGMYHM